MYNKLKQQNKKLNPQFFNIPLLNTHPKYQELLKIIPFFYFCDTKNNPSNYNLMVIPEPEKNKTGELVNICNSYSMNRIHNNI